MRALLAGIYNLVYRLTGIKVLAYMFAIIYVGVLNLVVLYGLTLLLKDVVSPLAALMVLFRFPFILATAGLVLAYTYWLMPRWDLVTKEGKKVRKYTPIIIYTLIAAIVFFYSRFSERIF